MTTLATYKPCALCAKSNAASRCPCGVDYCDTKCQKKAWRTHKTACTVYLKKVALKVMALQVPSKRQKTSRESDSVTYRKDFVQSLLPFLQPPSESESEETATPVSMISFAWKDRKDFERSIVPAIATECGRLMWREDEYNMPGCIEHKTFLIDIMQRYAWGVTLLEEFNANGVWAAFYKSLNMKVNETKWMNPLLDVFYTPIMERYHKWGGWLEQQTENVLSIVDKIAPCLSWTIPNDELLGTLVGWSKKIIDLGAGTGYLARLLSNRGASVIAVDNAESGGTIMDGLHGLYYPTVHMDMIKFCKMGNDNDYALLIAWPDQNRFLEVLHAINEWRGHILFLIESNCTAPIRQALLSGNYIDADEHSDCELNRKLIENVRASKWSLRQTLDLPSWPGLPSTAYVISRRGLNVIDKVGGSLVFDSD